MNPQIGVAEASEQLNVYSLRHLEALLGRPRTELHDLASHAVRYYRPFLLIDEPRPFARTIGPTKKRRIDNPIDPLKVIQSRIDERLLKRLLLPEHLLGGVRGKSISDNAHLHLAAKCLVTIDIKNFFPSISAEHVNNVFRKILNCSPQVSYLLAGLTTFRGRLPQGAPTSTLLANLVLSSFDNEIRSVCLLNAVTYSSFVDDLAFSGDSAPSIIGPVIDTLRRAGFGVSHKKLRVMRAGDRKLLNKLVLGKFITVQKQYRSRIRAGIHNLQCAKVTPAEVPGYIESLRGNINYVRLFDPRKAIVLENDLIAAIANRASAE